MLVSNMRRSVVRTRFQVDLLISVALLTLRLHPSLWGYHHQRINGCGAVGV
jgi:hypothetical protein